MNADQILDVIRPLVLVVDASGVVEDVRGGFGGFYGHDLEQLAGASVFDLVAPGELDELVTYFLESADRSAAALSLPLPFRVAMRGPDGREHQVDVIPTGDTAEGGELRWVVVVVPVDMQTSVSRSLEAEMAGEPRQRVKELLTEELLVDNDQYGTRWFLVDLSAASGPMVTTARADDRPMAEALTREVTHAAWRPWGSVLPGDMAPLAIDDLPASVRTLARSRNWRRVGVTPVYAGHSLVAAYLLFGRVPDDYEVTQVNRNVLVRIQGLVDATALLIARWHDRDRLLAAATRDPLTGLANRDAFADALAEAGDDATVLYIDIDHFKPINDRYGHHVGDRVLVEVAERVVGACRPSDVVARVGGDEFVVLLQGVDTATARAVGERIIDAVGAPFAEIDDADRVTVSAGLAALEGRGDVVKAADQAMLEAKRAGRARLVSADDAEPAP